MGVSVDPKNWLSDQKELDKNNLLFGQIRGSYLLLPHGTTPVVVKLCVRVTYATCI